MVYSLHGKGMVLSKIVFRSGNRHGKNKKKNIINDAISVKISFMDNMKWTMRTLVVFTPSSHNVSASCIIIYNQTVCPFQYIQKWFMFFCYFFFFSLSFSIGKRSTLAKIWGSTGLLHNDIMIFIIMNFNFTIIIILMKFIRDIT